MKIPTETLYPNKGSAEPRFNPDFAGARGGKSGDVQSGPIPDGPRLGNPSGIRQTSTSALSAKGNKERLRRIGLPENFIKE